MDRPNLQEQLDACRSVADAMTDPNLRELTEAMKGDPQLAKRLELQIALDAKIAAGLSDVFVPTDLKSRLTEAFRQGSALQEQDRSRMGAIANRATTTEVDDSLARQSAELEPRKGIISPKRRYVAKSIVAMFTVSAAVMLYFALTYGSPPPLVDWDESTLAKNAQLLATKDSKDWSSDFSAVPKKLAWNNRTLPLTGLSQPLGWKKVQPTPKQNGDWIVWKLNSNVGERVYLVASDAPWKPNQISSRPSKTPKTSSGDWSVGVWTQGGVTYAIVVEGDAGVYRSLIKEEQNARFESYRQRTVKRTAA